jgi:hypothetical protein
MGTYVGRYKPIAIGTNASYDTLDEQAALFVTKVNTATSTPAVPNTTTGATAKWVSVPTVAAASSAGATSTYKDGTVIDDGVVHLRVTAPDVTTTATVAAVADAIDKGAIGTALVAAGNWSDSATTLSLKTGETAAAAWITAVLALESATSPFVYLICESEIIKVTAIETLAMTAVRGQLSTSAAAHSADTPIYWYCGALNTVIAVDDPTVWGASGPADGELRIICGTEQMDVDCTTIDGTNDIVKVTRGYDGTTAAVHADNATVTQYIDEATTQFDVSSGPLLVDECFYKIGTSGTEVLQVKSISTNRITVQRAQNNSPEAVIADAATIFRIWGPETYDAALTAVNGTSGMPDFEEYGGPPVNTLGYNADGTALWSSETQVDAT